MSYRSLPSNIDRMKAAEVIVSQRVVLTRLLKHDLPNIAGKLYSKSIITAAVHDDALNQFNGAGIRTMSLLSAVEDGIRSEARVFAEFIEILESEPTLRSQANVLVKKYCQESGGIHRAPRVPPAHPMATQSAPPSDIDPYLEQIPLHNRWKLDKELDYDNEYDRDLVAVAENMINWEVYLKVPLGLTEADVYRIKQKRDSVLRQRKVLHIWKEKQTFDATYRKLLRCVVAGKDHKTAKKICDLDIFKGTPLQRGNLGGSQGYQQPTVDAREIFNEAMERGFVTSKDLVIVLVGIAGSGKSSFKRVALNLPPEEIRVSTPLAEAAIRNISISRATLGDSDSIEWEEVDSDKLLEMVADAIKVLPQEQMENPLKSAASPSSSGTPETTATKMKARDQNASQHSEVDEDLDFKDDPLLQKIMKSKGSRRLFGVQWVYIIDTGGQPQFLQLLPAFIKNISACVCLLRLDQKLDDKPLVQYFDASGKQVGKAFSSEQTNLQVIESCMRTIHSKCSLNSDKAPSCFIVGSYFDEKGKCAESIEEKNERLLKMRSNMNLKTSLMFYKSGTPDENEELIFPLDCKSPKERDHRVATVFKKCVMARCSKPGVDIPLAWFVLEERIRQKDVPYVHIDTCAKIARQLHMNDEVFKAALDHLLELNILRCYSSAPKLIFCTTQVVLQMLTEIVQYSYQLRRGDVQGFSEEDIAFKNEGIVTTEFLKRFSNFYSNLFTPEIFLGILRELLAIADMQVGEHFMPSLLEELRECRKEEYRSSSESLSALLILLHGGCIPNGLFPSLIVFLMNSCEWQLFRQPNGKPICLYQNCVTFVGPGNLPDTTVTLIASFSYVEVHINCLIEHKVDSVCSRVYRDIKRGLETSWRVLYPTGEEVGFSRAFFCDSCNSTCTRVFRDILEKFWRASYPKADQVRHHAIVSDCGEYERCSKHARRGVPLRGSKLRWLENTKSMGASRAPPDTETNPTVMPSAPAPHSTIKRNVPHMCRPGFGILLAFVICALAVAVIFSRAFYAKGCHEMHKTDSSILEEYLTNIPDYSNSNLKICRRLNLSDCNSLKAAMHLTSFYLAEGYLDQVAEPCWEDIVRMICKEFNQKRLAKRVADEHMNGADYQQYCK